MDGSPLAGVDPATSPLLTDLYQLNMVEAYLKAGMTGTAVFELFVRKLPSRRGFLVAAGLADVVRMLTRLRFGEAEMAWLSESGRFNRQTIDYFRQFRFTGDVDALPEGTVFFADEPLIRITAPLPEAQFLETRIINLIHFETLIASKAARMALAAPGKTLIDFGLRRAHGAEAGMLAARAAYIGGFHATATTLAGVAFGIPISGTMAHSFIQAHATETDAFVAFARARPDNVVLLLDTYDTEAGAEKVVALAPRLAAEGIAICGVRLDSGDLAAHARKVRAILDRGGLGKVAIFASGGLDEDALLALRAAGAPIDGFGIGTALTTSSDVPALDCAYKLQEYAGQARRKRSEGKATWPGRKQIYRRYAPDGTIADDVLTIEGDVHAGTPLVVPVMRGGELVAPLPGLAETRDFAGRERGRLPASLASLLPGATIRPAIAPALGALARDVDRTMVNTAERDT